MMKQIYVKYAEMDFNAVYLYKSTGLRSLTHQTPSAQPLPFLCEETTP